MKKILSVVLVIIMMLTIVACGNEEKLEPTPRTKEIIITLDNWDTYFEVTKKEEEVINKYNELVNIDTEYYFTLKNEFGSYLEGTSINVEISFKMTTMAYKLDLANRKILWGETDGETETDTVELHIAYFYSDHIIGDRNLSSSMYKRQYSDFKVLRIYGTLVLCE